MASKSPIKIRFEKIISFGKRDSLDWHQKIHNSTRGFPSDIQFPFANPFWEELRRHTESYLKKKGSITPGQRDKRLLDLIQEHEFLYGAEVLFAVGACARFMSPETVKSVLNAELEKVAVDGTKFELFHRITIVAHHENPFAVTAATSQLAEALLWCSQPHGITFLQSAAKLTSEKLEKLFKSLVSDVPADKFVYPHALYLVRELAIELKDVVESLKDSHKWMEIRAVTGWLSDILPSPQLIRHKSHIEALALLSSGFPEWQAWTGWKPCDTLLAQALLELPLWNPESPRETLEFLVRMQININPRTSSVIYQYVCEMIQKCAASLAAKVVTLKGSGHWLEAHQETGWLSILQDHLNSSSSGAAESVKLLDKEFPDWRGWAHWDERDSRLAKAIIPCQAPDTIATGQRFQTLIELMLAGISSGLLLRSHVYSLAHETSKDLETRLKELTDEGHWFKAYTEAKCLSILLDPSSQKSAAYAEVIQLVTEEFTGWKLWALWRPDLNRLKVHERLTNQQRHSLLGLLALEGPDFELSTQLNMREGIIARNQHTNELELCWSGMELKKEYVVKYKARHVLERLSYVVQKACEAGSAAVELLIYLCCCDQPIDENALVLVERSISMADASLLVDVLHVLKEKNDESSGRIWKSPIAARKETLFHEALVRLLMKLASASYKIFREALTPRLVKSVSTRMCEIQTTLPMQAESSALLIQLHNLGKSLQETTWLLPLLDNSMGILIRNWPSSGKLSGMNALRSDVQKVPLGRSSSLSLRLDAYYTEFLIEPGNLGQETKDLIGALIDLWQETSPGEPKRLVALILGNYEAVGSSIQLETLKQLHSLPENFVFELSKILKNWTKEPCLARVSCTRLLAHSLFADQTNVSCWRSLLFSWLMDQDSALFEYTTRSLKIREWHQWVSDLQLAFPAMHTFDPQASPKVLQPPMHLWALRIGPYIAAIQQWESITGSDLVAQCIRAGYECDYSDTIIQILKLLQENLTDWDEGGKLQAAVQVTLPLLNQEGTNATQLYRALLGLLVETNESDVYVIDIYVRVIETYRGLSPMVASALLSGWLESSHLANFNTRALENLVGLIENQDPKDSQLDAIALNADQYICNELHALHAESKHLRILRGCLKAKDPNGVTGLCSKLGISDTSPLEDEVASLPNDLVNAIELVEENVVEFNLSLAYCTALQRVGTGIFKTESLVVRVVFGSNSLPASFCIHLGGGQESVTNKDVHFPWLLVENKLKNSNGVRDVPCFSHMDRTVYRLGRVISQHLEEATLALEETYKMLKLSLEQAGEVCMICGSPHGVRLLRSTPCMNLACERAYMQSNLSLYTKDLRQDAQVADLLITAVQAAANTGNLTLLPNWPYETFEPILEVLEKLPPIATLRASKDIKCAMENWNEGVEQFLKRTFGHYGGFLVSASGQSPISSKPTQIRIPSMPGAYQFLLANAAPHLEKAFATRKGNGASTVVFHGTSLDRLYSILSLGLQGYHVSRPGRYGGTGCAGIYVAEEPLTSFAFANPYCSHSGLRGWNSGTFTNFRVLLACEATGLLPGRGVHVISDPSQLLVRYVFLIPPNMIAPRAVHIVPAIASVLASLRSGAL